MTNNNNNNIEDEQQQATNDNDHNKQPEESDQRHAPAPVRVRPIRPNLRRQVVVTREALSGLPIGAASCASVELAAANRCSVVPPKRPAHLPARYETLQRAAATAANPTEKPNRYSWAQMQQWQAAAAAAQAAPQGHPHHFSSPFSSAASRVLVVNPMHIVNLSEHTKSRLIKFIEAVKRFSEKWFSHVLLLLFLAVYACFGAYIFISFEAPTEQWEKQLIIDTRLRIVNETWTLSQSSSREEFTDQLRTKFEDYERLLNRVCQSGMTSSSLENQWTFWGALFYSMTVFTTIGYGHLTPITFAGRVATMVYAIFGIPILLMVLADLGKLLTRIIKYAFKKFRYLFNKLLRRKESLRTRKLISDNTNQYIGVARDAFERGFAYIQHPYNRFPATFTKMAGSMRRPRARHQQHHNHRQQTETGETITSDIMNENNEMDLKMRRQSVATDVIVTPSKQTKPVSPQPDEKKSLVDAHNHSHHHNRAHSPSSQPKRKISAGNHSSKSDSRLRRKGSVSRSSSSSNVPSKSAKAAAAAAASTSASGAPKTDLDQVTTTTEDSGDKINKVSDGDIEANVVGSSSSPLEAHGFVDDELGPQPLDGEDQEEGQEEEEEEEDFDIPVSFALFLLVTYMMFGAVVFSIWEGWNFFDALYFVFISMSTIGFGDLVPQHPKRMIGTFAYLLFGLALTSMCINVVQEKIHATFLRAKMQIGEKMGFDLDQIMADDYYGDSSLMALDGEGDDDGTNSVAVSQTNSNSQLANDGTNSDPGDTQMIHNKLGPVEVLGSSAGGNAENVKAVPSSVASKSRQESLKWKKRTSADSGSLKRKSSKKLARQTSPSSAQNSSINEQTHSSAPHSTVQTPNLPLKPFVERFSRPQQLYLSTAIHQQQQQQQQQPGPSEQTQPGINHPINSPIRGLCEPLQRPLVSTSTSPSRLNKLASTRSQPSSITKSLSSEPPGNYANNKSGNQPNRLHYSTNSRPESARGNRSLQSSRRSSVSQELNQLDDLIVALSSSRSPSERFGPLLGIPSSARSSRSNSPSNSNNFLANNKINHYRRGTSMTHRPQSRQQQQHQQSVIPNASSKRSFTGLSSAPNSRQPSRQETVPLSDSQAALDELEALKFSAV